MDDDLNTAGVVGLIFDKIKDMNRLLDRCAEKEGKEIPEHLEDNLADLYKAAKVLGILNHDPDEFFNKLSGSSKDVEKEKIEDMILERSEARKKKDWARADEIREALKKMNVTLEDGPKGTTWRFDV